jgi:phosphate transport system substrate-binding protein
VQVKRTRRLAWLALPLALTVLVAACGGDDDDSSTKKDNNKESSSTKLSGSIKGTGATFPDAFYQEVIGKLTEDQPGLTVTYNGVGSGQGKKDFAGNLNDFAGTDSLVKPDDGPKDGTFFYVPTVAAPITISYNLSGVDKLQLSAETLAKIMQGDIKKWDDAAIKADNPDATLPSKDIVIVHRADASGTTSNFTKYLDKAAKGTWKLGSGDSVQWPASSQAGQKNTGVAQIVKDTDGAIGYVDLSDAEAAQLVFASIKNKAGKFVEPTLDGATAALAGATVADDVSYDPLDADGDTAYPITAPTYILLRSTYKDQKTLDNVKGFVSFVLGDGQALAKDVSFASLPDELLAKAKAQLDKPKVG